MSQIEILKTFLPRFQIDVDLSAVRDNARAIRRGTQTPVMFVLKRDAYGHGATACAGVLAEDGADYFAVGMVAEGVELRNAGNRTPILVFGPVCAEEADEAVRAGLTLTVTQAAHVEMIAQIAGERRMPAKIHLKIETGMGRFGHPPEEQDEAVRALRDGVAASGGLVEFEGVYSHLAFADSDPARTSEQARRFREFVGSLDPRPALCHLANSAGAQIPECRFAMTRAGIALYGGAHLHGGELRSAMTARTRIVQARWHAAGDTISYDGTFAVKKPTRVGVTTVGYADGLPRSLSGRGWFYVAGKKAPILGRICMDQTLIDLTDIPEAQTGDEALIFGASGGTVAPVWELAAAGNTISYELIVNMGRLAAQRRFI